MFKSFYLAPKSKSYRSHNFKRKYNQDFLGKSYNFDISVIAIARLKESSYGTADGTKYSFLFCGSGIEIYMQRNKTKKI